MNEPRQRTDRIPIAAPDLGPRERTRVLEVLESGHLAEGEQVAAFETEFAAWCNTTEAIATSNGTTALHAALEALGIGDGDRVLTTPFSFVATANAIRHAGATPIFADVSPDTLNLDPDRAEAIAADEPLDAILVVHLYGLPADMDRFRDIASAHDLLLVEDAAQAHGATYRGQPVGSVGDVGCFSFYPTKNMTTGEGGMIVTDRNDVASRARRFCNHGRSGTYEHQAVGHNFRMTDLAAAIGRVQLERLPDFIAARRTNASALTTALEGSPLDLPPTPEDRQHAFHQYTVRTGERERFRAELDAAGIDTGVYYPTPIHRQPAYETVAATLPTAEALRGGRVPQDRHPNSLPGQDQREAQRGIFTVPAPS